MNTVGDTLGGAQWGGGTEWEGHSGRGMGGAQWEGQSGRGTVGGGHSGRGTVGGVTNHRYGDHILTLHVHKYC